MDDSPSPNRRWYHLTPDRLITGLLVAEGFLLLSNQFCWFPFNEKKGWTVLIGVATICLGVLLLLLWFALSLLTRIRFQFSIRSLLVLVAISAALLGWLRIEMERGQRQAEVVAELEESGANVYYHYEFDEAGDLIKNAEPTIPGWVRAIVGNDAFTRVKLVSHHGAKAAVIKSEWPLLKELVGLERLYLGGSKITDKEMEDLKGLSSLRELYLDYTEITDAGLAHLRELPHLEKLGLRDWKFTDASLKHLDGLSSLKWLDLYGNETTDEGVKKLQQALPKCKIER